MSKTFADLETGDVFSFDNHVGRESWVKTEPHQARVVNSDYARNVGDEEPVTVLYAAADRAERLRPRHDDTSVVLAGIRERARWTSSANGVAAPGATAEKSARDVPRLLRAVEAALKLADDAEEVRDYSGYETRGRRVGWDLRLAERSGAIQDELSKG